MKKIDKFMEAIQEQVRIKTSKKFLKSDIIKVENYKNMILVQVPGYYTFTDYVRFNGKDSNSFEMLITISKYLDEGIEKVFYGDVDEYENIDEYDSY